MVNDQDATSQSWQTVPNRALSLAPWVPAQAPLMELDAPLAHGIASNGISRLNPEGQGFPTTDEAINSQSFGSPKKNLLAWWIFHQSSDKLFVHSACACLHTLARICFMGYV